MDKMLKILIGFVIVALVSGILVDTGILVTTGIVGIAIGGVGFLITGICWLISIFEYYNL